ncbi:MAG: helix-turn-helix domain-containing protein [Chloroflexota bacterium]
MAALGQARHRDVERVLLDGFETALHHRLHAGKLTYLLDTLANLRLAQGRPVEAVEHLATLSGSTVVHNGWRKPEIAELHHRLEDLRTRLSAAEYDMAVARGQAVEVMEKVRVLIATMRDSSTGEKAVSGSSTSLIEPLTKREVEVLRLIVAGQSNRQIAITLTLAVGTVKTHAHNIYAKLAVNSRTEAVARAHELNLV